MSASPRIQSFADFWPYYIGEHRQPLCRVLHFVGTGGFMSVLVACLAINPARKAFILVMSLKSIKRPRLEQAVTDDPMPPLTN